MRHRCVNSHEKDVKSCLLSLGPKNKYDKSLQKSSGKL